MQDFIFWLIIFLIIALWVGIIWFYNKPKWGWLPRERAKYYQEHIKRASKMSSMEQIMQYDKIFSYILKDYGYEWTLSDQLRNNPSIVKDMKLAWSLHKLRNKLAHDLTEISDKTLKSEAEKFRQLLLKLL